MSNIKKFRIKSYKNKNNVALKLSNVSFRYEQRMILDNLNLELNSGEIMGLLGPNGVGKTSIFNIIIGLIKPNFGSIFINNEKINDYPIYERALKFKIGFVPQYGGFFGDLTVYENLKAISEITINKAESVEEKINLLISQFELESVKELKARLLSGGQRKKLVIALALISEPKILLLDEPFAALDVLTIQNLQSIIVNLQIKNNMSIILCDHQARDLLSCVDIATIINNGKIVAQGTPNDLIHDNNAKKFYFGDSFKIN
jgi:lipopolysaccharide export system ATP-binding protein